MSFYHEREESYADKVNALHCNEVLLFKYHCPESYPMTSSAIQKIETASKLRMVLLICGILASLVYVGTDILAGVLYPGYSFTSQAVSELFAIGAPTSGLVVPLFTISSLLLLAFAFGVWKSSSGAAAGSRSRALRIMALMIIGNAVTSLVLWNFFPMHMRGAEMTFTDTMHVILAINPFVPLTVVMGIVAFRNWFRFYSIGTILMMIVLSVLGFMYVNEFAAQQPTPWVGLYERISQYGTMLWVGVLAIVLLRGEIARKAMMLKASSSS